MVDIPKTFELGSSTIKIILVDGDVSQDIAEQLGSYVYRNQTIYLDKTVIEAGGEPAVNLLLHELFHAIFFQYSLGSRADEEVIVNSFANGLTELFKRTSLLRWITHQLKKEKK